MTDAHARDMTTASFIIVSDHNLREWKIGVIKLTDT